MEFTRDQLSKVTELAEKLTPLAEIAVHIDVSLPFLENELELRNSTFYIAYMKGKAKTAAELRSRILECAMAGSPTSIIEALHQLNNME